VDTIKSSLMFHSSLNQPIAIVHDSPPSSNRISDQSPSRWRQKQSRAFVSSPCAKVCNFCPLPTMAHSYILAIERHDIFQIRHVSKESLYYIASRWILSCFSTVLCISIAMCITKFCTWGGCRFIGGSIPVKVMVVCRLLLFFFFFLFLMTSAHSLSHLSRPAELMD
jgi:hypothetical protein